MSKPDGGPAYPGFPSFDKYVSGMTLRDYFAGQALAGFLSKADPDGCSCNYAEGIETASDLAVQAYLVADFMLAEREKT